MTPGFQERRNVDITLAVHEARHDAQEAFANKINDKFDVLDSKLDSIILIVTAANLSELPKRVTSLEKWRWVQTGATSLAAFIATLFWGKS